ncbi:MAG TPA: ATP-binding protein [Candidatus Marinimicrobia bacterium]|nr:ATP-binding protein [Candidatus Neomarinimicrobiota bacterium]
MKNRKISALIQERNSWKSGRILVLTGARQTGKTTLARHLFPDYHYISIEDPLLRSQYSRLTASQWKLQYSRAILDEVQKEAKLIESIKSVYDQWPEPRYILLGSSQLLLMEKVKESLAGRCIIIDFYPLTLPELRTHSWNDPVENSLFQEELLNTMAEDYLPSFVLDKNMAEKEQAWEHYLRFGAYPAVSDDEMSVEERTVWLQNYVRTYLERDIRDLASFRDLEPFIKLQRYLVENTASLLNATAVGNQLGITSKTVQRYLHYFEVSYQSILLPAWSANPNKRLSKMGKIHYLDNGIVQAVLQKQGGVTGNEFKSLVVAEIYKQIRVADIKVQLSHLRTYDGKEIDLLIETPDYYLAFEIKMTHRATRADAKNLIGLETILDKPLKRAYLLTNDRETKCFDDKTVALNVTMFLG